MKALRLHGMGGLSLHDEPQPEPKLDEALLRITAVGICGSDLHWFSEGGIGEENLSRPLILGHEFSAVVESGELRGQRVAVDPLLPCETCEFCLEGNPNLCTDHHFAGHGADDGALREFMTWPTKALFPLPDNLNDVEGAMLEPLGIAIHTVDLGKLRPGMTVGIFGCGSIGLLILKLARLSGASQIIATDKLAHRLVAAKDFGATSTYMSQNGAEAAAVIRGTKGRSLDVCFEAAGDNAAVETAVETCKPGGRVILCGIPQDNRMSFSASSARRKGLTIKMVRRMKLTYPRALRLVESGRVDVKSIVTHVYPLDEYDEAFKTAEKRDGVKVVIQPEHS